MSGNLADWEDAIKNRYWNRDYTGALSLMDEADAIFPANPALTELRLLTLVDFGRHESAIKAFQKAQAQNEDIGRQLSAESTGALAVAYDRTGSFDRARHFYNRSLGKKPDNYRAVLGLADLYRRESKPAAAIRLLKNFLEHNPDNPWALAALGAARQDRGKKDYERILETAPAKSNPDEKAVQALALWKSGRLKEALPIYAELMKEKTRTPGLMCDYAQALIEAEKPEQAKNLLYRILREYPNNLLARRLLASIYIRDKDYRQGETWLRRALALDPDNVEILRDLGYVQQVRRRFWSSQRNWLEGGRR